MTDRERQELIESGVLQDRFTRGDVWRIVAIAVVIVILTGLSLLAWREPWTG